MQAVQHTTAATASVRCTAREWRTTNRHMRDCIARGELQIGMVDERDGDGSHGRMQTCDAVIKRGGTAAPASLRHICDLVTITACGACTRVGAVHGQHIQTHAQSIHCGGWRA